MNTIRRNRVVAIIIAGIFISLAIGSILYALKKNINLFLTPSEVITGQLGDHYFFRLGGMVKKDSVIKGNDLQTSFSITDFKNDVRVIYHGILPDLFREGKGVIALGHLNQQGIFEASEVLAKHDENYMPKKQYLTLQQGKIT